MNEMCRLLQSRSEGVNGMSGCSIESDWTYRRLRHADLADRYKGRSGDDGSETGNEGDGGVRERFFFLTTFIYRIAYLRHIAVP